LRVARCVSCRQSIFLLLSVISVVTNAGLTVFTMNTLNDLTDASRYWIFILFQWVCFFLQVRQAFAAVVVLFRRKLT
jgi:prepilin signal peptidase PulO-like enzyme (type II secretory pathway)